MSFDRVVSPEPFTGRIVVMTTSGLFGEPRRGPDWFRPEPMFAVDVKDLKPGDAVIFDDRCLGFPGPPNRMKPGNYRCQAIMDFGRQRDFSDAPGNGYSKAVKMEIAPGKPAQIELLIDQVVREKKFKETEGVKLVEIESKLLTAFHRRPVKLRAGVVLPESFSTNANARYPVIYEIPGFGGDHRSALFGARKNRTQIDDVEMIHVTLDPDCPTGHHVFADSANNGPCGQALIEELIPEIEKRFRAVAKPSGRFVTGHSSGGWSSLWLQVTYPEFFGGVWSTSPDPVDFRSFQYIEIYKPGTNMFVDEAGKPRPIARFGIKPAVFYKPFSDMEVVMGHGGQLGSFEAVFSPKGSDGQPVKLWNRQTGAIDTTTAEAWKKYDIRLLMESNWATLGPKLRGKVHVYMGDLDTFYLEGAVRLLKESQGRLGSDAVIELVPGKDHMTLLDGAMRQRIHREMASKSKE